MIDCFHFFRDEPDERSTFAVRFFLLTFDQKSSKYFCKASKEEAM